MRAAATLGTRAVAGARGHARMRKSEPVNVTKKFFFVCAGCGGGCYSGAPPPHTIHENLM